MIEIGMSEDGQTVEIRIKIWYLAQIIDSDNWVQCIIQKCSELVVMHINEMKDPNDGENQ